MTKNDLIESLTVNFSDDDNFYFRIVDATDTVIDLSSMTVSNITGGSEFGVSQYAVPRRTNVEVVTENTSIKCLQTNILQFLKLTQLANVQVF